MSSFGPTEATGSTADGLAGERVTHTIGSVPAEARWPGLTIHRALRPRPPHWSEAPSLALYCVLRGESRVITEDGEYHHGPWSYSLLTRGLHFGRQTLEATAERPSVSFTLQIDPAVVQSVSARLAGPSTPPLCGAGGVPAVRELHVSRADGHLTSAVLRFLGSLTAGTDRRVLAPMYAQEIVYRLLQGEQGPRLADVVSSERAMHPLSDVIAFIHDRMSEPLTVADMAQQAGVSPSTLTNLFGEATGMGPYQFVKRTRLNRARSLLARGDMNVGEVARQVGYTSLSHFINEFKRHVGTTPRAYARSRRHPVTL